MTATTPGPATTRNLRVVLIVAVLARLAVFAFAENKHADAPMRALIAQRMNADPVAAADTRTFHQFGPLPIEIMRPFLALGDARFWSRVPALLAGLAVILPFFAFSRRLVRDDRAVALAGLALALSPLHIQLATTASSETFYLLFLIAACERLHAAMSTRHRRDFVLAGAFMSLAAVTRYDAWLAVPVATLAMLGAGPRNRRALGDTALFAFVSAALPVAYLVWSGRSSGDPLWVVHYINREHARVAAETAARFGPVLSRLRQVLVWGEGLLAAMGVAFLALPSVMRGWRRQPPATLAALALGLGPMLVYLGKGITLGNFDPLPRFALAPGAVVLPLACAALLRFAERYPRIAVEPLVSGGAIAMSAVVMALAFSSSGRIRAGAEALSPLTRLDAEDRTLAEYLRAHRRADERVCIDTMDYADIAIAHSGGIPSGRSATLFRDRAPVRSLREARDSAQVSWVAIHDDSWGRDAPLDWPGDAPRFGRWRLAHVDGVPRL